jgi:hypothetical protein
MFLCEAVIFICSILMVVWDMVSTDGMEGYEDMPVYTVMCSISTFCALAMTLSMLLVPTHVRSFTTGAFPLNQENAQIAVMLSTFFCCVVPICWFLHIKGVHEQVWNTLEEQGIGAVLATVAAKLSVASQMQPTGHRANKVACASTKPCQGAAQTAGCLQGASDAVDFKVAMSSQCAGSSHEQLEPDASVG